MNTDIMERQTAEEMVHAYEEACQLIEQGYRTLAEASLKLDAVLNRGTAYSSFDVIPHDRNFFNDKNPQEAADETIKRARKAAWRVIVNKLEIHKIASNKRWEEIQENLEKGNLPELTVPAIFDLLMSFQQNAHDIQEELVKEVFEILRPSTFYNKEYKTNSKYEIGKRVILGWMVEENYSGGYRARYGNEQKLISVDKVFHMLDGQAIPDGYRSPLVDAINTTDSGGYGETKYFKFRCCQNMNLHLEFKRPDLVTQLNAIAGGARLRDKPKTAKAKHQTGLGI